MSLVLAKMSARSYYGPHATGSVLLVNWDPIHFTGSDSVKERNAFMLRLIVRQRQKLVHATSL